MSRFFKKTGIFIVVTVGFMIGLLLLQDPELIVGCKKVYLEQSNNKEYDLVVLGSSRAHRTFNPTLYTGYRRLFNMAEDGHGFPSNYLLLKVLTDKHHLKIKAILLEVDELSFDGSVVFARKFRDDYFVTDINDPEVYEAFKKYRGAVFANVIKTFPNSANLIYPDLEHFIKNQVLSLRRYFPKLNEIHQRHLTEAATDKGYTEVLPHKNIPIGHQQFIIEPDDRHYFEKLVNYCQIHAIQLILYRAPILSCQLSQSILFDHYIDSFTKANKIPFYDYKCQYQWPDMFSNQNHPTGKITEEITKDILFKLGFMDKDGNCE